jgi:hypothetical protein
MRAIRVMHNIIAQLYLDTHTHTHTHTYIYMENNRLQYITPSNPATTMWTELGRTR